MKKKGLRYSIAGVALSMLLSGCGAQEEAINADFTEEAFETVDDLDATEEIAQEENLKSDLDLEQDIDESFELGAFGYEAKGENWHINQYRAVIEGTDEKDSVAINEAIKKLSESKEEYELWVSLDAVNTIDFTKIDTKPFTGLYVLGTENNTNDIALSSVSLPWLPNVNSAVINAEILGYLDPTSLNKVMKNIAENKVYFSKKGDVKIFCEYDDAYTEEAIKTLKKTFKDLDGNVLREVWIDTRNKSAELVNAFQDISAEHIRFETWEEDYYLAKDIKLNDTTKSISINCGSGGLTNRLTIDAAQSVDVNIYTEYGASPENTIYSLKNGGTIEISARYSLPTQASIDSLKQYNGIYNGDPVSELTGSENVLKAINSASEYVSLTRENRHVTITIDVKDEKFAMDKTISDILQFAKKYDIYGNPDIVLNVLYDKSSSECYDFLSETSNYDFRHIGNVIINLYTATGESLSLFAMCGRIDNLTINCHAADFEDYEQLNYILSTKINDNAYVSLNGIENPEKILIFYDNPYITNVENPSYYLIVNGEEVLIVKKKGQTLAKTLEKEE